MQALDLRSVVSKEACRAIAVIGQVLGVQFQAFGDIWLPKLLRQAALKVQVVNVAADKCIRICIAASRSIVGGYPRLLALFLDQLTTSKVPVVRRFTLEYACLACAIWPVESLDKHMILFRTMITAGATDADPLARRAARQLYWILREKSTGLFTAPMEALLQDLEISTQKHMNAEIQQPNADLLLLLRLASGGTFDPSKYTATTIVRTSVPSVSAPVNTATVINNPRPARSISSPRGGQSMQYTTANSISDSVATNTLTMNDNSIEPLEPRLLSGPLGDVSRSLVNRRLSIASGPVRITPKPVNLSTQDKVTVPLPVTTPVGISNSAEINYLVPNAQVVSNINASAASLLKTGPLVKKLVDNNDDGELARSTKLLNVDKENRADFVNIGRSNTNLIVGAALLGAATTRRILSDTSNNSVNKPESFMHTSVSEQKLVPVTDLGRIVESQSDVHKPSLAPPTRVAQRRQSLSVEVSNNTEVESHGNVPVSPWNQIPALPRLSVNISEPPAKSFLFEKPSRVLPSVKSVVPTPANTAPVVTPLSTPRKPSFSTGPANRPPGSQSKLHSTDGCSAPSSATQSVRKAPLDTSHRTSALNLSTASSAAHSNSVGSTPAKGIPVGSSLSTQTGIDAVRSLAEDTFWTTRLQAFEWLNSQLREIACISEVSETRVNLLISTSERVTVDFCLDLAVSHLSDTHHKVALESFVTLDLCIGHFASAMEGKIGQFLLSLFARLSDRRQLVKDAAAVTLEKLKQSFSPELQVTALAPKLHEVSERTKAVVFSFMATLVPACADYFAQSQATFAFLNRLSCILSAGSGGAKPPTAVMLAGQKLLEAVYQVAPTVVCSQLAASPMQSQAVLKRLLERCAPTIDTLVQTAGRFDSLARQLTARPIAINRDNTVEVLDAPLIVPNILTKDNSPVISQSHAELIQIPVQIPIDVGVNASPTIASPVTSKSSTSVNINTSSASKPQSMLTNQSARNTPDIKSDSKTRSQLTPVIPTTPVPRVSPQTVSTPLMAHGLLDPLQVLAGLQQGASRQLMERATHTLQTLAITGDTTFWLQYSEQVNIVYIIGFLYCMSIH